MRRLLFFFVQISLAVAFYLIELVFNDLIAFLIVNLLFNKESTRCNS